MHNSTTRDHKTARSNVCDHDIDHLIDFNEILLTGSQMQNLGQVYY